MQRAGHVRWRNDDAIRAAFTDRLEIAFFFPCVVPVTLNSLGLIGFIHSVMNLLQSAGRFAHRKRQNYTDFVKDGLGEKTGKYCRLIVPTVIMRVFKKPDQAFMQAWDQFKKSLHKTHYYASGYWEQLFPNAYWRAKINARLAKFQHLSASEQAAILARVNYCNKLDAPFPRDTRLCDGYQLYKGKKSVAYEIDLYRMLRLF